MSNYKKFSLSLQKQFTENNVLIDSEVDKAFNELKIKTLLNRSGIRKAKGYIVGSILLIYVLLAFIKVKLSQVVARNYQQRIQC